MKKSFLSFSFAAGILNFCFSQTTYTSDYYYSFYTNNCNAFSNQPYIGSTNSNDGSLQHFSTLGQPKYNTVEGAIILECSRQDPSNPNSAAYGTEYSVWASFYQYHQYRVRMRIKQENAVGTYANLVAVFGVYLTSPYLSNGCSGPQLDPLPVNPDGIAVPINANGYADYEFFITNPLHGYPILHLKAVASPFSQPTKLFVRSLSITDVTPSFPLTASSDTRICGQEAPVTFTISNPQNATVTAYKFLPAPGQWLYQGNPAPAEIIASNSITLTPVNCATNATVSAKVVWNGNELPIGSKTINATSHAFYEISSPTQISSNSSSYELQIAPGQPVSFFCPTSINWSVSDINLATIDFTQSTPTQVVLERSGRGTSSGNLVLTASLGQCGQTINVARTVSVSSLGILSELVQLKQSEELKLVSVSPNPGYGIFKLEWNKLQPEAKVIVTSMDGRIIRVLEAQNKFTDIDISNEPAGIYTLRITDGNNVIIEKIVKN